ncbi:hypothetical protein OIE67_22710 [Nonomuraea fuscirosea]|nr:hypothetical protein [Nonomuraea fuscirosea]WSA57321.1 hypothetical protein OIE67_22710 [Nonomuraea fuscirosea]
MAWYAVTPTTGSAAACSYDSSAGFRTTVRSEARTSSANAPAPLRLVPPSTSSPGFSLVTSAPTASTTPAKSLPTPRGKARPVMRRISPLRIFQSIALAAAAFTRTRTSPRPGRGGSKSSSRRTSGPPKR